jgi:hypothetical protein
MMFLDSDQLWFLGNLPTHQQFSKLYAPDPTPPPTTTPAGTFASSCSATLPTTIAAWKQAQTDDSTFLADVPSDSLTPALRRSLSIQGQGP